MKKLFVLAAMALVLVVGATARDWTSFCSGQFHHYLGMDCDEYLEAYSGPYKVREFTTFNGFGNEFPYWEAKIRNGPKLFLVCEDYYGLQFESRKSMVDYQSHCVRQRQHW